MEIDITSGPLRMTYVSTGNYQHSQYCSGSTACRDLEPFTFQLGKFNQSEKGKISKLGALRESRWSHFFHE